MPKYDSVDLTRGTISSPMDTRVRIRTDDGAGVVGRPVVGDEQFKVSERLGQDAADAHTEMSRPINKPPYRPKPSDSLSVFHGPYLLFKVIRKYKLLFVKSQADS